MRTELSVNTGIPAQGAVLDFALAYGNRGWPVLPLHEANDGRCSCGNPNCPSPGKHPRIRRGVLAASTDAQQIQEWFTRWPNANLGVATGLVSGLLVVDLDGELGAANFSALLSKYSTTIETLTVRTGNGRHLLFTHPGLAIKNSVGTLAQGVDIRAERGYVVAPPSLHHTGRRYEFEDPTLQPTELPEWLEIMMTTKPKETTLKHLEQESFADADKAIVCEGERNERLFKMGCAIRGQDGLDQHEIAAILLEFNTRQCDPPLNESEVLQIADSVCKFAAEVNPKKSAKRIEENPLYWFKFNVRDFFSDERTQLMTDCQTGWHTRLTAYAWKNGGFLTADRDKLFRLAKAKSRKVFEKDSELVLDEYEPVTVNGVEMLKNPRMAAQYAAILSKWEQKRDAGNASREAWQSRNEGRDRGTANKS